MKRFTRPQKLLIFFYIVAVITFSHHFIFRPIILDWGAPATIRNLQLSGDVFTEGGKAHTRAVLVNATPDEIWPWLIQLGQDRGGMYSYELLENLVGADMNNVYEIRGEFQKPRSKGDTIWLANKHHYKGKGYQIVAEITPAQSFVMIGGNDYAKVQEGRLASGAWAFYLHPENAKQTWLIARSSNGNMSFGDRLLRYMTYEVPHFIMERKMLLTIKRLIEQDSNKNRMGQYN
jgi:hypothetical protein